MVDLTKTIHRPNIPTLIFRNFVGEDDYQHMLTIIEGCKEIDGIKRTETLDDIRSNYEHLVNCESIG